MSRNDNQHKLDKQVEAAEAYGLGADLGDANANCSECGLGYGLHLLDCPRHDPATCCRIAEPEPELDAELVAYALADLPEHLGSARMYADDLATEIQRAMHDARKCSRDDIAFKLVPIAELVRMVKKGLADIASSIK